MEASPDFVLVFSLSTSQSPIRGLGENNRAKVKQLQAQQLKDEYNKLVELLRQADLTVTGRRGAPGTDTILLFVKASEKRVREEVTRERMSDWLHGVASPSPSPREPSDFASHPIEEAERLRVVYSILAASRPSLFFREIPPPSSASPRVGGSASIRSSASTGEVCGLPIASQLPQYPSKNVQFPHLVSMFPPHNPVYNKLWLRKWNHLPSPEQTSIQTSKNPLDLLAIPQGDLDELKAHLGPKVALYFAFLTYYFRSLIFPSALGFFMWLLGLSFHPILGIGFVGWSVIFVETWRIREKAIAVQWGQYGLDRVEENRPGFQGDGKEVDPVTGTTREKWRFRKTLTRGLASIPAYLAFVGLLGALISGIYIVETLLGEVYDGPGKMFLTLVPTCLFVTLVPQVNNLWHFTASKLTTFENHPHQTDHESSLTLKIFALQLVSAYGNLLLTSFVYIPFGSFLVPHILGRLPSRHAAALSVATSESMRSGSFSINSKKLRTQFVAYSLTNQITGAFLEVGLPYLKAKFLPVVQEKLHSAANHSPAGASKFSDGEHPDEKAFLERIRKEQLLPVNEIGGEYAEMVVQFGYLVLFAVIWPISPIWSLVNNFFEIRSDAFKLTTQARRPIPSRAESIGPWLDVLGFLSYLGAVTTSSLIYLYQPHRTFPGKTAAFLANVTHHAVHLPTNGSVPYFASRLSAAQSVALPPASDKPDLLGALPPAHNSETTLTSIRSTLLTALVVALAASHFYAVARQLVRWLLVRLEWDGSVAAQLIRRRELELKRAWLDEHEMRLGPREIAEKALGWKGMSLEAEENRGGPDAEKGKAEGYHVAAVGDPADAALNADRDAAFWKREDEGIRLVEAAGKTE
ncbi:hypothetical protein JCM8097_008045 [Rhodosporidiobolus ruineniae]